MSGRKVGVITTDTARAGGVDQLAAFTKLLKLKLLAVEDTDALADALSVQRGVEQVLIDSAGRNPFDADDMNELGRPAERRRPGAGTGPAGRLRRGGSRRGGSSFRELGARRLLLTRLDMTRRLGSLLAIAYEARLELFRYQRHSAGGGRAEPAQPKSLARLLLPNHVQHARTNSQANGNFLMTDSIHRFSPPTSPSCVATTSLPWRAERAESARPGSRSR